MSKENSRAGKGSKSNFFQETFNQKKKTVRELRGGTAKEARQETYRMKADKEHKRMEKERGVQPTFKREMKQDGFPERNFSDGQRKKPTSGQYDRQKPYNKGPKDKDEFSNREGRDFSKRKSFDHADKPFKRDDRRFEGGSEDQRSFKKDGRNFDRNQDTRPFHKDRPERNYKRDDFDKKNYDRKERKDSNDSREQRKPYRENNAYGKRDDRKNFRDHGREEFRDHGRKRREDDWDQDYDAPRRSKKNTAVIDEMPLNKFIAYAGICGRREAAELVKQGKVKVNGDLILEPGYKVQGKDKITLSGKPLNIVKDLVYILLNKPKDHVTTTSDPEGRKTVMDLVASAEIPRLFPIGRLDRNTTGVLLLTNDGDLTQKLSHPKFNIKKVYQATLDKDITKAHFEQLLKGIELEDGIAVADAASILDDKNEVGLEIHSGKNRIVRRMFEALGYRVEKLDRVMYAGLTKKNVPRGKWRFLTEKEVVFLKHFK